MEIILVHSVRIIILIYEIIETNIDKEKEDLYIKYSDKIKDFSCPIQGTCKCKSTYINLPNIDIELQNIYH